MEALEWLKKYKNDSFAANAFTSREATAFVKKLYKLKAKHVEIEESDLDEGDDCYSDMLTITLPKNKSDRLNICAYLLFIRPDEVSKGINNCKEVDWNKDDKVVCWWD